MVGRWRIRRPVTWKTALAMAGATPTTPRSPMPLLSSGLMSGSCSSMKVTSIGGISVGGDEVLVQAGVEQPRGAWVGGAGFKQGLADAHDGAAAHLAFGGSCGSGAVSVSARAPCTCRRARATETPPETARPAVPEAHKEPPW